MNLRLIPGFLALALCATVTTADASPINVDPSPDPFLNHGAAVCVGSTAGPCDSYEFTFALPGFDPVLHNLLSADLTLRFYDDNDNHAESASVEVDGVALSDINITSKKTALDPFVAGPLSVVSHLQGDGLLKVMLGVGQHNAGNNDFYFHSASLVALWERIPVEEATPVQPAPEPVELALFGTALMAFAFRLRRRS